jgi:hypothetical protein
MDRTWTEILIDWFPMLLLIAVWIGAMYWGRGVYTSSTGKTHGQMLEEHIAEMKRQNDLLEQLVKDQESRLQRLEATLPRA